MKMDYPRSAPQFFLLNLPDKASVEWVLGDADRLDSLHMPASWSVPQEGDPNADPQRAFGLMPFQEVVPHEWTDHYRAAIAAVCAPTSTQQTMRDWAAAARAAGPVAIYRARALLVLAVYDSCWLNNAACRVLTQWIEGAERRADLSLSPNETKLLKFLAAGPVSLVYASDSCRMLQIRYGVPPPPCAETLRVHTSS
jgi:hypothetical protein